MKLSKLLLAAATLATVNAYGSSILVDVGTPTGTLASGVNPAFQTNAVLNAGNTSHTYLYSTINDSTVSYGTSAGTVGPGNPNGIVGSQVQMNLTSLTGTGSIEIIPRDPTSSGFAGTFDIVTSGVVDEFCLHLDFLNPSGTALGMAGADTTEAGITPIAFVRNDSAAGLDLDLSLTDAGGNTLFGYDYIPSVFGTINMVSGSSAAANMGVSNFAVPAADAASIHRFDDATNAATGADREDDLFSGITSQFRPGDGTTFADGSVFRFSMDSRIFAENGVFVPEPSRALLMAMAGGLMLFRRRR